jgi:molybdopterin-guanine dinucleotide biosynthesis protein A
VCQRVVVSGNYAGFECIADNETDAGPLAGLQAIAHAIPCAALLVIPVDMPYLNAPVLSGLMDQPCNGFYNHEPLPAYFHRSKDVLLALKQLQQQGIWPTSIWRLHQQLNSKSVQCDDDLRLRNFNTPEQWHARNEITD